MDTSLGVPSSSLQPVTADRDLIWRSTRVDQYLAEIRQALEDCGITIEALAREHWRVDKSHAWRVLHAAKPFRVEHYVALPDAVRALVERRRAERSGFIVVELVHDEQRAMRDFVSGLFGVLVPQMRRVSNGAAR